MREILSASKGRDAEATWRGGEVSNPMNSEVGLHAPIQAPRGAFDEGSVGVRDKLHPHDASFTQKVHSVSSDAEKHFDQEMEELLTGRMIVTLRGEEAPLRGEIVSTDREDDEAEEMGDFPEISPKLRPEPLWDGTLSDLQKKIKALHSVIMKEGARFNQLQDEDEKAKHGKFLAYLFEDMDTWIHRFEEWKAEHDIQKAVQDRDQKNKPV